MTLDSANNDDKYLLGSVTNALSIIDLLAEQNNLTLKEIAVKLGLSQSSVFRTVYTLEKKGFVTRDQFGRCRLGIKFSFLGSLVLQRNELIQVAKPYLEELELKTGEIVHLAIWDDNYQIRFVDKIDNKYSFNSPSFVGLAKSCYSTACGKAMLAFRDPAYIDEYISNVKLVPFTNSTITDPVKLKECLTDVYNNGYCISNEEDEVGLTCIGAPILNAKSEPIGAVSISGPTVRMQPKFNVFPSMVVETAAKIAAAIK